MTSPRVAAVVVAAGRGRRLDVDGPKALAEIGGRPLVAHALDRLQAAGIEELVVVYAPERREAFSAACGDRRRLALVAGGCTREDSVRAGVAALSASVEVVAVHDAARGLCPAATIRATVDALRPPTVAVAPALPIADTLKRVTDGSVVATVDRADLVGVQTPQVVRRDVLDAALAARADGPDPPDRGHTDDLGLVEEAISRGQVSGRVRVVDGDVRARKVTWPGDLEVAEALLAAEGVPE